jgi:hypothetical protein
MKIINYIQLFILLVGCLAVATILFYAAGKEISLGTLAFSIVVLSPYLLLIALSLFLPKITDSQIAMISLFPTSLIYVIVSVVIYYKSIFESISSTSALVFVVIPVYSAVFIPLVYGLSFLIAFLIKKFFM